jgi:hypothetical protein
MRTRARKMALNGGFDGRGEADMVDTDILEESRGGGINLEEVGCPLEMLRNKGVRVPVRSHRATATLVRVLTDPLVQRMPVAPSYSDAFPSGNTCK